MITNAEGQVKINGGMGNLVSSNIHVPSSEQHTDKLRKTLESVSQFKTYLKHIY